MPSNLILGKHFEEFIDVQLASGRYENASEVVRDALRLLEEKERRGATLDVALRLGIADADAGRLVDADTMFDALDAELSPLSDAPHA